jgi:hypothetical protein
MSVDVDRRQVLAYRLGRHGLDRRAASLAGLGVLDLGVQESSGSARMALAARTSASLDGALTDGTGLALAWTHRGAPHFQRAGDLGELAAALWPRTEADAGARMGRAKGMLTEAGISRLDGLRMVAEAWHEAVTEPGAGDGLTKGDVSRVLTERLPGSFSLWCRACESTHINELLFRVGALPGGARIVEDRRPLTFTAVDGWAGVPAEPVGTSEVIGAYLRMLGPATPTEAAGYIGTSGAAVKPAWPDDLVEVRVEGRPTWIAEADLADLRRPRSPKGVRLLPAFDPYLQTRDRDLIVPDPAHQKALWRILGNPGAVLVDGEILGTWRSKQRARGALEVTVVPFTPIARAVRQKVEREVEVVAGVRDAASVDLRFEDG